MNTVELLQHLDFKPSDLMGMGFDPKNPTEFTVNILKDGGAERYHLYGDKDNFVVSLVPSGRDGCPFLSACPTSEALPFLISYMSQAGNFSREVEALREFQKNLEAGKLNSLGHPEERYSEEVKEFLGNEKSRTLSDEEVKEFINKFRGKSGYEPSFDFNKESIVGKIGDMRSAAFGVQKDTTNSLGL
ncbi:TPA: hypothetical protein QDB51_003486 [Burkholderia vietnamiensis]|nr:hypothetical protein [Burkholderia vietnamiensis]